MLGACMKISISLLVVGSLLAACSSRQEQATNSSFATPDSSGSFSAPLGSAATRVVKDANGEGYAYQVGTDSRGLAGQSGLLPGTTTQPWASTGTATFKGTYNLLEVSGIGISNDRISGVRSASGGSITLTADFAKNTLTGTSSGGLLVVNGAMTGNAMGGTVTYKGVAGDLTGVAGTDQAFGAFQGNNENLIYAGGFSAAP